MSNNPLCDECESIRKGLRWHQDLKRLVQKKLNGQ